MPPFAVTREDLARINVDQQTTENVAELKRLGGVQWLLSALKVDAEKGISASEVEARKEYFGSNKLEETPPESWLSIFLGSFNDTTLIVLIVSAVVSLVIGMYEDPRKGWVEGAAILSAVLAVATVTATNDYSKDQQFRALNAIKEDIHITVRRDHTVTQVSVHDIVVGDIVVLESGDKVPADGVLVEAFDITSNESSLTGEAEEIAKGAEDDPFLLSGCQLTGGTGTAVVIAVGTESRWGRIRDKLTTETKDTPLQEKLDDMANFIGYVGMAAAFATFVAIVGMWYLAPKHPHGEGHEITLFDVILKAFIMAVTIVVVAVPEGLPLAVTISLAYSTKKMLRDNNLIRHLAACETMGNATTICSDKTGTLTENRMTVTKCYLPVCGPLEHPPDTLPGPVRELVVQGVALNTTANLWRGHKSVGGQVEVIGNKTEGALLNMIDKWEDYDAIRETYHLDMRRNAFSSKRKKMSVLLRTRDKQGLLYVKGAAEIILADCVSMVKEDGSSVPLSAEKRAELEAYITKLAKQSLRTICLAHRRFRTAEEVWEKGMDELEEQLTLDAIVGITDPLRKEVVEAVRICQRAGIMVRMVTGDNVETAKAIARQCGILTEQGKVLEGPEFRRMTPAQLDEVLPFLQVLARSSPDDKYTLVARLNGTLPESKEDWLKEHPGKSWEDDRDKLLPGYMDEWSESRGGFGEVVGVTGDGTNDAPALKVADVGLSMGLSGTEVAKEASDIVIMDDNFSSIVKAVLWGRSVFDNIRKFLQFQLTVNVVALTITFLSAVSGYDPPLNAVMMLWVNLIMDTMGALALGTEAPDVTLLDRRPYKRNASLISRPMWRNILVQSAYQILLLILLLLRVNKVFEVMAFWTHSSGSEAVPLVEEGSVRHLTLIFNAFVFCQIFNEFNARSIGDDVNIFRDVGANPMFELIIVFTVLVQYLIVQYGGDFTRTEPLSLEEWKVTGLLGFMAIPLGVAMRFIPVKENPDDYGGTAEAGYENVEPTEKPHGRRRRLIRGLGVTVRLMALIFLPILVAMCLRDPKAFRELIASCSGVWF